MKTFARLLPLIAILSGATTATAAEYTSFRHPANQLSRQFIDGSCLYKIIYGNYGSTPYATVHLYGGKCGTGEKQPYVVVDYEPNSLNSGSGDPIGGKDVCGSYIAFQATGASGHIATRMWVYFPVTNSWKLFAPDGERPTVPASPYC
ncbi:MAG TPA: hypothetical protein VE954_22845 [Oligoflexus sp.]|uniref:hypothetical protein n=1 Tax=Oligoflexus sp. TaxID=1971216 RepID=UPI002D5EA113|nr:hypothetical protein [Oligoflexus sp.]HYX35949.1 hypothetical protein [Oligoflexus sp.]